MKKLISLTIIFILLLTLILSSCVDNVNNTSDVSNTAEDSSFEESSESPESIVDSSENSEVQSNAEVTENSSDYIDESSESNVSQDEIKYDFNKDYPDFCTCNASYYSDEEWYDARYLNYTFKEFLLANGYYEQTDFDNIPREKYGDHEDGGLVVIPEIYLLIKGLSIPKEIYMEFREQRLALYEKEGAPYDIGILTDREIELFFGGYSDELIMKELKTDSTYYFEGALYTRRMMLVPGRISEETVERMVRDESFRLDYYTQVLRSGDGGRITSVEECLAKLEAEEAETAE